MADVGTPPPRTGTLSKLRRNKDKGIGNVSTTSLTGTSGESEDSPDNGADSQGLRASMENALDKVRSSRRRSVDDRSRNEDGQSGKLSTLVSKAKRKVRKGDRDPDLSQTTSYESGTDLALPGNRSESSLLFDESGRSSLLTDDERTDGDG